MVFIDITVNKPHKMYMLVHMDRVLRYTNPLNQQNTKNVTTCDVLSTLKLIIDPQQKIHNLSPV